MPWFGSRQNSEEWSGGKSPVSPSFSSPPELTHTKSSLSQSDEDVISRAASEDLSPFLGPIFSADLVQAGGSEPAFKEPVHLFQRALSLQAICDLSNQGSPTLEEQVRNAEFEWVDIPAHNLESMAELELMRALRRRTQGRNDEAPEWLIAGLKDVKGPVDWLLKVKIPAGVKRGQKVAFNCAGVRVESKYGGRNKSTGGYEVFAMQSMENKVKNREFVWCDVEAEQLKTVKDLDLMRALERRNRGEQQDVPPWLRRGLEEVKAPVAWLLVVKVPAGVKKGKRITFTVNGEKVKAVYNGEGVGKEDVHGVVALLARATAI